MRRWAVVTVAGLVAFSLVVLVPFWWIATMSFKTYEQIQFAESIYVPRPFTWENYTGLWLDTRFPLWLRNSVVTAVVVTLVTTVVASLSGYAVARVDLFAGATVVVTPSESTDPAIAKGVGELWSALGARVVVLDPDTHDRAVAAISHLPHVAAWALVDAVARFEPDAFAIAARGFKDTTRIAASDPDVWREILTANRDAVRAALLAYRAALDHLESLIASPDPAALIAKA